MVLTDVCHCPCIEGLDTYFRASSFTYTCVSRYSDICSLSQILCRLLPLLNPMVTQGHAAISSPFMCCCCFKPRFDLNLQLADGSEEAQGESLNRIIHPCKLLSEVGVYPDALPTASSLWSNTVRNEPQVPVQWQGVHFTPESTMTPSV